MLNQIYMFSFVSIAVIWILVVILVIVAVGLLTVVILFLKHDCRNGKTNFMSFESIHRSTNLCLMVFVRNIWPSFRQTMGKVTAVGVRTEVMPMKK